MSYLDDFKQDSKNVVQFQPEKMLENSRITLNEEIKPPPPVIQVDNLTPHPVTIFTEGNISVIQGKA